MDSLDIFKSRLPFYCNIARNDLVYFYNFNRESEQLWSNKSTQLECEIAKELAKVERDFHEGVIDSYQWDSMLTEMYPSIHRESLIISIFNLLEHHLSVLCSKFSKFIEMEIKPEDLKDKGITRSFTYLSKVVGIKLDAYGKEMPFIKGANLLRNLIVHNGCMLTSGENSKATKFINKNDNVLVQASGKLIIKEGFIKEFFEVLFSFWDKLGNQVLGYFQAKFA